MPRKYTIVAAVAALLAPAVTRAQPYSPTTPLAFTAPTRTYTVSGCGSGVRSYVPGAPAVPIFCLDGTATVGVATTAGGSNVFQTLLDLTGTRLGGFDGRFFDADYSNLNLHTVYRRTDGTSFYDFYGNFAPPLDPTGHWTSTYVMMLGTPIDILRVPPDGVTFGPVGLAELAYLPSDAPGGPIDYGRDFRFALTITDTPEPAPLALTVVALSGLALLGAGVRRRQR